MRKDRNEYEEGKYVGGFRDVSSDQWQEENRALRAGKGSSYDRVGQRSERMDQSSHGYGRWGIMNEDYSFREAGGDTERPRYYDYSGRQGQPERARSAHFEKFAVEGNRFIREVANELGTDDHNKAVRVTKAVLHAVRDRIPPDDAVQFAQGLNTVIKGIYFEQYDISRTPVVIRHRDEFIDFVRYKNRFAAVEDFRTPNDVVNAIRAVFRVLDRHMDYGQTEQVKRLLGNELRSLIDERSIR